MATIKLIEEHEASPEVREVYEDVKRHFDLDFVPNVIKAMAHNPQALKEQWEGLKVAEDRWGKETFYLLSLAVDVADGCDYCISFDTAMLKRLGWDDAKIEELVGFVSLAGMYNTYVTGLQLETDVTPDVIERLKAA